MHPLFHNANRHAEPFGFQEFNDLAKFSTATAEPFVSIVIFLRGDLRTKCRSEQEQGPVTMEHRDIKIIDSIVLASCTVKLREDGIIHLDIKDDIEVTEDDIREMNSAVGRIGAGKKYPNLITVGKYTSVSKEARDYAASEEANIYTLADAYVLHSFHQKILGNFFMKFNKPKAPVKFFNEEQEAITWLKQFVK